MTLPAAGDDTTGSQTPEQRDFDRATLTAMLRKDTHTSYGLTLVLGCPLPSAITDSIEERKQAYNQIAPGRICFQVPAAYHLTVYGLKRSQVKPYSEQDIDTLVKPLEKVLRAELREVSRIVVHLSGSVVMQDGTILICGGENEVLTRLRVTIGRIAGVDPLKSSVNHVTVGQFSRPFGSTEAHQRAMKAIEQLREHPVGELAVQELKLVYYRNRLLHDTLWHKTIQLPATSRFQSK